MIARTWHGWTGSQNTDAYESLLKNKVFVGIEGCGPTGLRSMQLLRRTLEDEVESVTSMWIDSTDSVRVFAGEEHEAAVVPSKARTLLTRFDAHSQHYQIRADRTLGA